MELIIRISRLVQVIMFPNVCGPRQNRKTLFNAPKRRGLRGVCALARTPAAFDGPIFALRQQTSTQARRIVTESLHFRLHGWDFAFAGSPVVWADAQMRFEVLQLAQPFDSQAAPDCALRSRRLGSGRLGDSTIAGAKAGLRAASAKNRPFWPVGDKTGDSSHKPDRKADITRDSSAFSRKTGPKTASQPPQPADNRTFWPRPDKTCDY